MLRLNRYRHSVRSKLLYPSHFALAIGLMVVCGAGQAQAGAVPGDLLVTESTGSIVNIRNGGDFTGLPRFATGLSGPFGLCIGPGDEVYATEFDSGQVTIVSAGGDFTQAAAFASGLQNPELLVCDATQILVYLENSGGKIIDITGGGDFSTALPFATGLVGGNGLLRDGSGTLWVALGDSVVDATAGGDLSFATAFASNGGFTRGIAEFEGKLLYSDLVANAVIDFTAGGDLSTLPVFANVTLPGSLLAVPGVGLFTASGNTNDVDEISAGGDFRTSMPFASGLIDPFGMVYVPEPLAANLQWTALATLVATASWRRRAVDR
jgi:hypothetical protein